MNYKKIGVGLLIAYSVIVTIGSNSNSTDNSKLNARLINCQNLASDLDNQMNQLDNDYANFVTLVGDYTIGNINYTKFSNDIDMLIDSHKRINFQYANSIDKYNTNCFGL